MVASARKLSAAQVDRNLKQALRELRKAERNAVLWFSEIFSRKLYRSLGYSSVHQYASEELGFSKGKTSQFIRLCESLQELPALRETVRTGEVSWTKAREVVRVATPETEESWVALARGSSRREIEKKVEECRKRARAVRSAVPGQETLLEGCDLDPGGAGADGQGALSGGRFSGTEPRPDRGAFSPAPGAFPPSGREPRSDPGPFSIPGSSPPSGNKPGSNPRAFSPTPGGPPPSGSEPGPGRGAIFSVLGPTLPSGSELGSDPGAFSPVPGASPPSSGGSTPGGKHPAMNPRPSDHGEAKARVHGREAEIPEVPMSLNLRFSSREYARYEALLERIRKLGRRGRREVLLLEGLAALVEEVECGRRQGSEETHAEQGGPSGQEKPAGKRSRECRPARSGTVPRRSGASSSPYQIVVQRCPDCASGSVVTGREPRRLSLAELEAILCDCREEYKGRNRAAIPPSVRRRVLARDGYRCRAAGCGRARFLEVHHCVPRGRSGPNSPENLLALCSQCHALVHELGRERTEAAFPRGNSPGPNTPTPKSRVPRQSAAANPGQRRRPAR